MPPSQLIRTLPGPLLQVLHGTGEENRFADLRYGAWMQLAFFEGLSF